MMNLVIELGVVCSLVFLEQQIDLENILIKITINSFIRLRRQRPKIDPSTARSRV